MRYFRTVPHKIFIKTSRNSHFYFCFGPVRNRSKIKRNAKNHVEFVVLHELNVNSCRVVVHPHLHAFSSLFLVFRVCVSFSVQIFFVLLPISLNNFVVQISKSMEKFTCEKPPQNWSTSSTTHSSMIILCIIFT